MARGTRFASASAVAAALMLASCSADKPATTPITTPVTTPTSTPTTTSTPPPVASSPPAEDPQFAVGKALIERHFATYNESLRTGDTKANRATFTSSCARCLSGVEKIEQAHKAGYTIVGGGYTIVNIKAASTRPLILQTVVEQRAVTLKKADGRVVEKFDAVPPANVLVRMSTVDGSLRITEVF